MTTLSETTMLASLSIRSWGGSKIDKLATKQIHTVNHASASAGKYRKSLLPKDALAEIKRVAGEARLEHYALTLPWRDDGARILSSAAYLTYTDKMRTLREKYDSAVKEFLSVYALKRDEARGFLGDLFDESDYPDTDKLATKFDYIVSILPTPEKDDFRVNVSKAHAAQIRRDIEEANKQAIERAMGDAWRRVAERCEAMAKKLRDYNPDDKRGTAFRDSLVNNIKDLAETLPLLNIIGSKQLDKISEEMINKLCVYAPETLRTDESLRESIASEAEKIYSKASAFLS